MFNKIKSLFSNRFKDLIKNLIKSIKNNPYGLPKKLRFLYTCKRFEDVKIQLYGKDFYLPDSASFIYMYKDILFEERYRFKSGIAKPIIIDAGANIGVSLVYFKNLFPNAEITAFEPDPNIYSYLKRNVEGLDSIDLINKGLFDEVTKIGFSTDQADGGSIYQNNSNKIEIETCLLSDYLDEKVNFLKIDIEGAETKVLHECKNKLKNVENLFIEYHSFESSHQTLHEILQIVSDAGFRYYISDTPLTSVNPFMNIEKGNEMDMQINISCVKE